MLYLLGSLKIEVVPFNVHEADESGQTDYAIKPVAGAEPPLEYVGEGGNEMTLTGRLFPEALGGGDGLELLSQMRVSGRPQYLMRGDGRPLGWQAILRVETSARFLNAQGVGKQIGISIGLRRARAPTAFSFFSLMSGLAR